MTATEGLFVLIVCFALIGLVMATNQHRYTWILFITWTLLTGVAAGIGFFEDTVSLPPRFVGVLVPSLILVTYLYRSIPLDRIRIKWLLALHTLRIPVELLLYQLYLQGQVPQRMTFAGWNWDIISGISAVLLLLIVLFRPLPVWVVRLWNWSALLLLLCIVVMAVLSAPTPIQQWDMDQPNRAVFYFPYTWLPAVVVPVMLLAHLLLFRSLSSMEKKKSLQ